MFYANDINFYYIKIKNVIRRILEILVIRERF